MRLMKGLEQRNGIWRVRVAIPADLRAAWGKREEIISLNTTDEHEAIRRGAPLIADIKQRIKAMRNPAAPPPVITRQHPRMSREEVFEAIQKWRREEIEGDYRDFWNGEGIVHNPESASQLRYLLGDHSRIDQIETFTARLADILDVPVATPFLQRQDVREWWRVAWLDVAQWRDRFSRDDFNGWPEEDDTPAPVSVPATTPTPTTPIAVAGIKVSDLRDQWDAVKPLDPRQKGYIRRLIEHLGDRDIANVTPSDMDGLKLALDRFPKTKKPADDKLAFADLLAAYEGTNYARLSEQTKWNWIGTFKSMFGFAVSRRLLAFNPAEHTMPKPSAEERLIVEPYSEADLDRIFTRPMFKGFAGKADSGYRDKAGGHVVKDSKYWLPIVALHTGMRLEELASLKVSEIIDRDGVLAFDLTARPLKGEGSVKNRSARRIIPLHQRLTDLGFAKWMQGQTEYVFPDLTADAKGKRGSQFTKWWGLWSRANAEREGEGIDREDVRFHSFRHAFKRAARESKLHPEISDLLTGHSDGNTVARGYGRGVSLPILKEEMDRVKIRWP